MPIVIVGMLDEREPVIKLIKEQIEKRKYRTILIDVSIGTGAIIPSLKADITGTDLLKLTDSTIEDIKKIPIQHRETVTSLIAKGLTKKVIELYAKGDLEGIIAIGGMTGSIISLTAMKELPFGVPKILISSTAAMPSNAKLFAEFFSQCDIMVINSVVDTVGLNLFVKKLAINGANAIWGMVEGFESKLEKKRPMIAITEFGFCEKGAFYLRRLLEKDYEIISFHATGIGDQAAAKMVREGVFEAFIDLVPASYSEYLLGGNRSSGPNRLDIALNLEIPYILSPCGFDMISCGPIERKDRKDFVWETRKLSKRKIFVQDVIRVQARTTIEEMKLIARAVAERLNRYPNKRLVKFIIPKKGFSSLSTPGGVLYDPDADQAFTMTLHQFLDPEIQIIEVDADVNHPEFAMTVAKTLRDCLNYRSLDSLG
jgi:uncharacterized protein (UPF0261 family)